MYKCGWNGCEKAYGTLNHLNAHVTMQSHGQKRVPEGMLPHDILQLRAHMTRWSRGSTWTYHGHLPVLSRLDACVCTNLVDCVGKSCHHLLVHV